MGRRSARAARENALEPAPPKLPQSLPAHSAGVGLNLDEARYDEPEEQRDGSENQREQ